MQLATAVRMSLYLDPINTYWRCDVTGQNGDPLEFF